MTKKICISGYYGFDNFGDETILSILVNNLKSFNCNPDITVFSSNPNKTAQTLNVNSVKSFDIKNVIKEIYNCDCLISGGGSLLQDATSKKSLIYYLTILLIAQLFRKRTIIFAQGIGPINNKFLMNLTLRVLKKANHITVRDLKSLELLKSKNINANLCSDPVWNINIDRKKKENSLGIQLRDYHTLTNDFIENLANAINKYYSNKNIYIFSLQNKLDLAVCNKLKTYLQNINSALKIEVVENTSNEQIIEDISAMEEIIAMRYHACLVAIKAGSKLLPISYDIKVETIAKEFDIDLIDINTYKNTDEIIEKFSKTQINYCNEKISTLKFNFNDIEEAI